MARTLTKEQVDEIAEIENQINGGSHYINSYDLERNPRWPSLIRRWLVLNGVPERKAILAKTETLVNAYRVGEPYLRKMREDNPKARAIDLDAPTPAFGAGETSRGASLTELLDGPSTRSAGVGPQPSREAPEPTDPNKVLVTAAQITAAAESVITKALAQIKSDLRYETTSDLQSAITASLATTKAQLAASISDQVKAELARLAPPRKIEVVNTDGTVVSVGRQHDKFPILLKLVGARGHNGHRLNIWLTGPTGSGKTTAVEQVAKALKSTFTSYRYATNGDAYVVDSNGEPVDLGIKFDGPFGGDSSLDADYKVIGYDKADGTFRWTTFLRIFCFGGVYIADEIDNWMPSALVAMNAPLANGWVSTPLGMMRRHPDCCIIAAANTWGMGATDDYVGRSKLDAATINRFPTKIDWPIDERLEMAIAVDMGAPFWCEIVQKARRDAKAQGLKVIFSPRNTFEGIATLNAGFTVGEVISMNLAAGLRPEQIKSLGLDRIKDPPTVCDLTFGPSWTKNDESSQKLEKFKAHIGNGARLEAIKQWRLDREDRISLKDAKDFVEDIMNGYKPTPSTWELAP